MTDCHQFAHSPSLWKMIGIHGELRQRCQISQKAARIPRVNPEDIIQHECEENA